MIVLSSAAYDAVPGTTNETAGAVTTDADENVYVTGVSDNGAGVADIHSVKYSKTLGPGPIAMVYSNAQGDNQAKGITVDGLGNIIVAGRVTSLAQQDFFLIKYSPNFAAMLSSTVFDGGILMYDEADAVGVDSQNNIFVTGYSNDGTSTNFYTLKYGPDLGKLSTAAFDGSGNVDQAAAIAVDHSDNVIVAGFTRTGTNNDFFVRKYDNDLKPLYSDAFGSGGNNDDRATGVAVDSADNIIVTGRVFDGVGSFNYCTRKYDPFLNFISSAVYDSGPANNDIPTGVATDSNDNIIVTGQSGSGLAVDYFTIKYDKNFAILSSAAYNGGNSDTAVGIRTDVSDNALVIGTSYNGTTFDYFTIKYNASPKITEVAPLYIGETVNVALKGNGFISGSSVAFTDAGISTGAVTFTPPNQLSVSATLSPSVMLGVTTVTVFNINGESVTNFTLASTRLKKTISAGSSGVLTAQARAGQVLVTVPAGTFPLFQEQVTIYAVPAVAGNPSPVGEALRLEVSPAPVGVGAPQQDIEITLHYSQADLGDYPEDSLSLAYFSTGGVWVPLTGSTLDAAGNSIRGRSRFVNTEYAIVKAAQGSGGGGGGAGGSGIPAKVYPNPYRPGSGGSFDQSTLGEGIVFAQLGANAAFTLTIVDVAGQLVYTKSGTANADGKYLWDVKTASGGKAASGVYLYFIKGSGDPKKGKFSIIR
ncbi:MAG: hypothetical protein A2107_11875 [Verrucomicrobia bacterium GWF2_62_7]|nr:MAG: hypothetical protein A2107_11875 [Verrucomicrobia bacterium GWF2_62_7]